LRARISGRDIRGGGGGGEGAAARMGARAGKEAQRLPRGGFAAA